MDASPEIARKLCVSTRNIPVNETVTVLSGVIHIGVGDTFERTKARRMATGSFVELPGKINRYSWNQTEVIVEVHSFGPSPLTYANPADDPSNKH